MNNRTIFIFGVVLTIGLLFVSLGEFKLGTKNQSVLNGDDVLLDLAKVLQDSVALNKADRDPFKPYLYQKRKKRIVRKRVIKKVTAPKKEITLPPLTIDAILWGASPVAILKIGGKTEFAKKGQSVGALLIKDISQNSVTIVKEGKTFVKQK